MEFDTLPYIFPNPAIGSMIYWDIMQKYAADKELKDVKVLSIATIPPMNYAGNKPIKKLSDFKGLRMRMQAKTESWIYEAVKATPVEIATSDLATSLERGLVDGMLLTWSAILSFGVKDVDKYEVECNLFSRTWMIILNRESLGFNAA